MKAGGNGYLEESKYDRVMYQITIHSCLRYKLYEILMLLIL